MRRSVLALALLLLASKNAMAMTVKFEGHSIPSILSSLFRGTSEASQLEPTEIGQGRRDGQDVRSSETEWAKGQDSSLWPICTLRRARAVRG